MKRRRLSAARRVNLPEVPTALPGNWHVLGKKAYGLGKETGARLSRTNAHIRDSTFTSEIVGLGVISAANSGLFYVLCAVFFLGAYRELSNKLRLAEMVSKPRSDNLGHLAGFQSNALVLALMNLNAQDSRRLSMFDRDNSCVDKNAWWPTYTGAIAIARLAHHLITSCIHVYLPTWQQYSHWKIDLIARVPHECVSICFQVTSNLGRDLLAYSMRGECTMGALRRTNTFVKGVGKFERSHHGLYVPVEVEMGGQNFHECVIEATAVMTAEMDKMIRTIRLRTIGREPAELRTSLPRAACIAA